MGLPTIPALHEVSGVIHCHSTYSDGAGTVPEIAAAANRAGLDFLLLTDHDTLAALHEHGERRWGRTLVLVGAEITPRHNHYLVYGVQNLPHAEQPPQLYIDQVGQQGGFGIIAHPWEAGSRVLGLDEYGWQAWDVDGFDAIEIWNFFSGWVSRCTSLPAALIGLVNWRRCSLDPDPRTLARWDEVGTRRRVVGIGGVDAHGVKKAVGPLSVHLHPYRRAFHTVRTHLLLPGPLSADAALARAEVLATLRGGRAYVANWLLGDPAGFRFAALAGSRWLEMGDEHPHPHRPGAVRFLASPPAGGESGAASWGAVLGPFSTGIGRRTSGVIVRLCKDGQVIAETDGAAASAADQGPGVYRAEVFRHGRGWVYSNPIYLR